MKSTVRGPCRYMNASISSVPLFLHASAIAALSRYQAVVAGDGDGKRPAFTGTVRAGDGKPGDWPMPEVRTFEPEPLDVYRTGLERFIALGDEAVERLERTKRTD